MRKLLIGKAFHEVKMFFYHAVLLKCVGNFSGELGSVELQ